MSLPLNEIAGLDFFTTCYIWSDIFRCASIGLKPSHRDFFPYLSYLTEDRIRLDHVMGCKNRVMTAISEISILEAWKKEMQIQKSLSMSILSTKAAIIEQKVQTYLESLLEDFDTLSMHEHECNLVSRVNALAALPYLAVVVSGNSHQLPEVRESVPKTLTTLKAMPPHLLIRVAWAYCVSGCLATDAEKEDFRQLLLNADRGGNKLGILWNGLELMEEFWCLRENADIKMTQTPWVTSMDSLGLKILLI
jgi:hypothetical protein